ncbi:hypothetical protein DSO57_1023793 [Entomophthora muscae]|uniref:Uncharacterized protein n=1 Tax=Entomophthora muscae TaxID=34485 RepID=A0ACC2SRZ2_9FUNG|nr:hypothetical protein DSO57_1023793 [Entomophthora muscae]
MLHSKALRFRFLGVVQKPKALQLISPNSKKTTHPILMQLFLLPPACRILFNIQVKILLCLAPQTILNNLPIRWESAYFCGLSYRTLVCHRNSEALFNTVAYCIHGMLLILTF